MKATSWVWVNVIVLSTTFLVALIVVPIYAWKVGFDLFEWTMFGLMMALTGFSITVGYHRMWSHRAFKAHPAVRLVLAIFGAASLQNTILHWCADHRNHHKYVDDPDKDPYAATKGFIHSHIGWILRDYPAGRHNFDQIKDLQRDPICQWQHRYYLPIAIAVNAGLPLALGWMHGKLWGTFLLAGILRVVLNHHFTFFINSLAHMWGTRGFSTKNSSRDNPVLALVTYGEGFHNYHHAFQFDYRNGIRWYHFDPAKWIIRTLSFVGLTEQLKRAPKLAIYRARLETQREKVLSRLSSHPSAESLGQRLDEAYQSATKALEAWNASRQEWLARKGEALSEKRDLIQMEIAHLKEQCRAMKRHWYAEFGRWRAMQRQMLALPVPA